LNLPFGSEEGHLIVHKKLSYFWRESIHLAGTRFPQKNIPTRPFVGLEEFLGKFLPYAIQLELVHDLIDSANTLGRCILPWNNKALFPAFANLREVFACVAEEKHKREMQKLFWENVRAVVQGSDAALILPSTLEMLIHMDVDEAMQALAPSASLSPKEKASLKNIGDLYRFFKQDALYFKEYAAAICEGQERDYPLAVERVKCAMEHKYALAFVDYPLTGGFYLLARSAGLGQFSDIIGRTLQRGAADFFALSL
jgi:hypothetical protein